METLANDAENATNFIEFYTWFLHCGYVAILCVFYFFNEMGPIMAMTCVCIGITTALAFRYVRGEVEIWKKINEKDDEQNKKLSETFNSIKMLKLFGWESIFAERIGQVVKEKEVLKK